MKLDKIKHGGSGTKVSAGVIIVLETIAMIIKFNNELINALALMKQTAL